MRSQVAEHPNTDQTPEEQRECCPEIPELRRLQYFYGQLLSSADLRGEQSYFREKLRLINRCVHGHGVICGLEVVPAPDEEPCDPETDREREELEKKRQEFEEKLDALQEAADAPNATEADKKKAAEAEPLINAEIELIERQLDYLCPPRKDDKPRGRLTITCGVALDCRGNEIIVRRPKTIDLYRYVDDDEDEDQTARSRRRPWWVSICFCESPVDPVRPVYTDACQPAEDCRYGKIQDSYRIVVSRKPPKTSEKCEACCCDCEDGCVLLARIDPFSPRRPIPTSAVHNDVRRRFGLYDWVTLTSISWVHGGEYSIPDASSLLGRHSTGNGLEFRFSRPVRTETLTRGVIDVTVTEGGSGRSGQIYNIPGEIHYPSGEYTDRVYFRQTSDDTFHNEDILRIRLRADFVLDACCKPVDGNHVGGLVPLRSASSNINHPAPLASECRDVTNVNRDRSGNGTGGGTFESWIVIREAYARSSR